VKLTNNISIKLFYDYFIYSFINKFVSVGTFAMAESSFANIICQNMVLAVHTGKKFKY